MVQDVIKDARQDASDAVKILRGDATLTYLEISGIIRPSFQHLSATPELFPHAPPVIRVLPFLVRTPCDAGHLLMQHAMTWLSLSARPLHPLSARSSI
jgi:hypothetical protein